MRSLFYILSSFLFILTNFCLPIISRSDNKKASKIKHRSVNAIDKRITLYLQRSRQKNKSDADKAWLKAQEKRLTENLCLLVQAQKKSSQKGSLRQIMLLCRDMRMAQLWQHPGITLTELSAYGSLGLSLLIAHPKEPEKAFDALLNEAWLFSRAARTALFLFAQTDFSLFPASIRPLLFERTLTFYHEACMKFDRTEEGSNILKLRKGKLLVPPDKRELYENKLGRVESSEAIEAVLFTHLQRDVPRQKKIQIFSELWKRWWHAKRSYYRTRYGEYISKNNALNAHTKPAG